MKVIKIERSSNKIISVTARNSASNEEMRFEGDYFISTMPVKELIEAIEPPAPPNVVDVASGLIYRDFITVGILLNKMALPDIDDNWIYIQEPEVKLGRLQIFNNWSPFLVKDPNTIWLGLEYFCNDTDELWNKPEEELKLLGISELVEMGLINKEDVLDTVVIKMPKAYPAYFGTYNRFNEVREYTDQYTNLFLIGRNGMHKYNNQDHSMLTAMEVIKNIKSGKTSNENIWFINSEQEYHEERSA